MNIKNISLFELEKILKDIVNKNQPVKIIYEGNSGINIEFEEVILEEHINKISDETSLLIKLKS